MKRFIFIVSFLALSAGLTWLVWFRPVQEPGEEKKPEADVPVHTAKITRATLRGYVIAYGTVEPEPTSASKAAAGGRIASPVAGAIAEVKAVEGQRVEKGALLFVLDDRVAKAAAERARQGIEKARQGAGKSRETVKYAELTLQREQVLIKQDGTSQKKMQDAEQQLATARADLAAAIADQAAAEADLSAAETQLKLLHITAPLTGTLVHVNVRPGETIDPTTVLAEMVDLDRLVVSASVASAELANLKTGQPAEVAATDATNVVNTTLAYISAQVDPKTGSGLARAALPANSGLRAGQFVKVRIISEEHKDCLAVPVASVARDATGATFIALVEGEKAVLKPVKVGLRDGNLVEIEGDGVEADKTVVTEGAYGIVMTQQFSTKIRVVNE